MKQLPILKFEPILKSIVWGGRRMESVLGRRLPSAELYGESWEISDLVDNQSTVQFGAFSGAPLETLLREYPREMLGTSVLLEGRFPLLFKFIDASQTLSVQVHPDVAACAALQGGARPKTEAWYIIDCRPDARLYVGLKKGVAQEQFEAALRNGTVEQMLHSIPVAKGEYVFLPSGTVHAIGEGIVLAEVQQSSNTTYRVFDWNRMGLDGTPRELHVTEALASIHFDEYEQPPHLSPLSGRPGVRCEYFSMETVSLQDDETVQFSSQCPIAVMCTAGSGSLEISAGESVEMASLGQTLFIPACVCNDVTLHSRGDIECVVTLVL